MAEGAVRSYFAEISGSSEGLVRAAGEGEAAAGSLEKRIGGVNTSLAGVGAASKTHLGGTGVEQASLLEKGVGKIDSALKNVIGSVVSMGTQFAGLAAVGGLGAAVSIGTKDAIDFQQSLTLIATQAGDTTDNLQQLGSAFESLGPKVGQTPEALSTGFFHLASAGYTGAQALTMLQQASELADVGQSDLETTTNLLVSTMKSGVPGINSAADAVGTLNAIVGSGNMRMQDLVDAMGSGILPVAGTFGVSMQSIGAALSFLTDQGVPAADAATKLRMSMSLLAAPSAQATKLLTDAGLSAQDAADQTSAMQQAFVAAHVTTTQMASDLQQPDGLVVALTDLKNHMDAAGVSAQEQDAVISRAFGGGRSGAAIIDMYHNLDAVKGKFDEINKSAGAFPSDWAQQQKTGAQAMNDLKSAADVALTALGTGLLPTIEQWGQWVADHSPQIEQFGKTVGQDLGTAFHDTAGFIANDFLPPAEHVIGFIADHKQAVIDVAEAIGGLYVAKKGASLIGGLVGDMQSLLGLAGKVTGLGGLAAADAIPVRVVNWGGGVPGTGTTPVPGGTPAGASGALSVLGNLGGVAGDVGGAGIILSTVGASGNSVGGGSAWSYDQQAAINDQTSAIQKAAKVSDDVAYMWAQYKTDAQHTIDNLDANEFMWGTASGDTAVLNKSIADLMQRHDITSAQQLQTIENAWNKGIVSADNIAQYTTDWDNVTKLYGSMNASQQQEFNSLFQAGVTSVGGITNMMGEVNDYSQKYGPPTSSDLQQIAALVSFGVTDVDAIHSFLNDAPGHASDVTDNLKTLAGLLGGDIDVAQSLHDAITHDLGNIGPPGGGSGHSITDLIGQATGGLVSAAATGGFQSGLRLVGEHGPELAVFRPGTEILPNRGELGFGLPGGFGDAGGSTTDQSIHIHGPIHVHGVEDPAGFFEEVRKEALRQRYNQGQLPVFGR